MSWLGANEVFASKKNLESFDSCNNCTTRNTICSRQETVEAALNRISKAYIVSMECVAALHKVDVAFCNKAREDNTYINSNARPLESKDYPTSRHENESSHCRVDQFTDDIETLIRAGTAARSTFENLILSDPLVAHRHAPTLNYTLKTMAKQYKLSQMSTRNEIVKNSTRICAIVANHQQQYTTKLSSMGHKSVIQNISYLSLVNYGDLLIACLPAQRRPLPSILDRGVVANLRSFGKQKSSLQKTFWFRFSHNRISNTSATSAPDFEDNIRENLMENCILHGNLDIKDIETEHLKDFSLDRTTSESHAPRVPGTEIEYISALPGNENSWEVQRMLIDSQRTQGFDNAIYFQDNDRNVDKIQVPGVLKRKYSELGDCSPSLERRTQSPDTDAYSNNTQKKKSIHTLKSGYYADMKLNQDQSQPVEKSSHLLVKTVMNNSVKLLNSTVAIKFPESEKDTVRLAVVAYIDATFIDGSDPTLWLKLACASRRLGRLLDYEYKSICDIRTTAKSLKYRHLEKYALERAMSCLDKHETPNRTAIRALQEWKQETAELGSAPSVPFRLANNIEEELKVNLELTQFTWSSLGRMVLKACKQGSRYSTKDTISCDSSGKLETGSLSFSSATPNVLLTLSPIIILPLKPMAVICSYLYGSMIQNLMVTCRDVYASIVAVQGMLFEANHSTEFSSDTKLKSHVTEDRSLEFTSCSLLQNISALKPGHVNLAMDESSPHETISTSTTAQRANRVSKRLRSQLMALEKRSERLKRQQSPDYCLIATIFGCDPDDDRYTELIALDSESISRLRPSFGSEENDGGNNSTYKPSKTKPSSANTAKTERGASFQGFTKDASLITFVDWWKNRCSCVSPFGVLFNFVAKASIHMSDIYSTNPMDSMMLSSLLFDFFEVMASRVQLQLELIPSWQLACAAIPRDACMSTLDLFALDLIYAELRLKRCELKDFVDADFDDDGNFLSSIVSVLLRSMHSLDLIQGTKRCWFQLKARCLWFISYYYLWRSRISVNVVESRVAEHEGLRYVDAAIQHMKQPMKNSVTRIFTPHLESRRRKGVHWRELSSTSLAAFSSEIQASSIVLQAQEQYMVVVAKELETNDNEPLSAGVTDTEALFLIGKALLERYHVPTGSSNSRYSELLDNFLTVHGSGLLHDYGQDGHSSETNSLRIWFDKVVYLGLLSKEALLNTETPCILTILIICLQAKKGYYSDIALLILRLVTSLLGQHEGLMDCLQEDKCDSNDDASISSKVCRDSEEGRMKQMKRAKLRQCGILTYLMLGKLDTLALKFLEEEEKLSLVQSHEFCILINQISSFCSNWFVIVGTTASNGPGCNEDFEVLYALKRLVKTALLTFETMDIVQPIFHAYFHGLTCILASLRRIFDSFAATKPAGKGRHHRLQATRRRADLVALVCCEIGSLLSRSPFTIVRGRIMRSYLVSNLSTQQLALLVHNLLCLWKAANGLDYCEKIVEAASVEASYLGAYLDSFGRNRMRIPLAVAIIGLCGSGVSSTRSFPSLAQRNSINEGYDQISLAEFYDSDASANDLLQETTCSDPISTGRRSELLRVIMQAVHCVKEIFYPISEADMCGFSFLHDYVSLHGPLLPLVVCRVLNTFANCLLTEFGENKWSKEYPHGTRTIGSMLDSVLHKAYKCLHGFSLSHQSGSEAKENLGASIQASGGTSSRKNDFRPESSSAAAMLYRCVIRAYSQGRKSPPKASLDLILDALPEVQEMKTSQAIHQFLFSQGENFSLKDVTSMVTEKFEWGCHFSNFEPLLSNQTFHNDQDECFTVRRGVSSLIAQGPIPRYQDSGDFTDSRVQTFQAEEELSRKFTAIIDDLSFNKMNNVEGWFKASQCLMMKAELIADRIGLSKGYARNQNFCVTDKDAEASYSFEDLEVQQEKDFILIKQRWLESVGLELSLFVRYSWSSLESLKLLSVEIEQSRSPVLIEIMEAMEHFEPKAELLACFCKKNLDLFINNNITAWQETWGGIFVSSLRKIAHRCLIMSIFVAYKNGGESRNQLLISEIVESLGVTLYSELMGSQTYGYPMHVTPDFRIRQQAEASLSCFERTIEIIKERVGENMDGRVTWDLFFMIGKCHEKIAKTYVREKFVMVNDSFGQETSSVVRKYECHMSQALKNYTTALIEAKEVERNGEFAGEQDGGSNHGAAEALYRLHATRLKCLLTALNHSSKNSFAENEALRLTESTWFVHPNDDATGLTTRDRVWRILADVVAALARCRLDNPYFHRSVYRHAQALMWAPVFYDPAAGGRSRGSLATVPANWAVKIRGLNYGTDAANSAAVVISSLFEKKRNQLCAVWVTESGSMSSFQSLNNSVRKYDSLRGKYISAYVESLRLCNRSKEIESFLRWTYTSHNDLPALFAASAESHGGMPKWSHTLLLERSSLSSLHFLTSVKRMTNKALAAVILKQSNDAETYGDEAQDYESKLKIAYACFLRLNCKPLTVIKRWSWKHRSSDGVNEIIGAVVAAYRRAFQEELSPSIKYDWTADLNDSYEALSALKKCKELFPTLTGNWFSLQKAFKKRNKLQGTTDSVQGAILTSEAIIPPDSYGSSTE